MKKRTRKKAYDCSHHVLNDFLVTDDPYPIHNTEDYCKLGKFDNTWTPPSDADEPHQCENCIRFCASRPMIRKEREERKRMKEFERDWRREERLAFLAGVSQKEEPFGIILDNDLPF